MKFSIRLVGEGINCDVEGKFLMVMFGIMIVLIQKISSKITIKIAPNCVNMIGIALRVIKFN